ncbi:MAG: thioredoxin [Bacteroidota bacterium]|nr:thioredoxin [Bacteroidota bacterium]
MKIKSLFALLIAITFFSSGYSQKTASGMSFDDYLAHLKSSDKLVLVDFNAVWCGPCKTLKPLVHSAIKKNSDKAELFEIDVDKNPVVSSTMQIKGIPLLILYNHGKEVWRSMGLIEESVILEQLKKFSPLGSH